MVWSVPSGGAELVWFDPSGGIEMVRFDPSGDAWSDSGNCGLDLSGDVGMI